MKGVLTLTPLPQRRRTTTTTGWIDTNDIFIYNILSLFGGGHPFHPSVPSSIHPSSSSRKKKMMEEEEDEWQQEQFIQMFM
jgi:hypothetical protein